MHPFISVATVSLAYAILDQTRRVVLSKEQRAFATLAQEDHWNHVPKLWHPDKWYVIREIKNTEKQFQIAGSKYGSNLIYRVKNVARTILFYTVDSGITFAGTAIGIILFQLKQRHAIAAVATAALTNIAVQSAAVQLERQHRSNEKLLKVNKECYKINPEGAILEKFNHALPTLMTLDGIYRTYIATSEGSQWLKLAMEYHDKDEEGVFLLLANRFLGGTCAGWALAQIKTSSLFPNATPGEMVDKVEGDDIVYFHFQHMLQTNCLMADDANEAHKAFCEKNTEVIDRIRTKAFDNQKMLNPQVLRWDQAIISRKDNKEIDARGLQSYAKLINMIDEEIEKIESSGCHAYSTMSMQFNRGGHCIFIRYEGDHFYFSCNNTGFYAADSRQELHATIAKYLQSLPQAIEEVEILFYAARALAKRQKR